MIALPHNKGLGGQFHRSGDRAARIKRQTGKAFCLDAVIQSLCAHYRMPIPSGGELRRLSGTTRNGASLLGAKNCLEQVGFVAEAGQCGFDVLNSLSGPAIAVVTKLDGSLHYVLINPARFGRIEVLNPAGGTKKKITRQQFEENWTGTILITCPKPTHDFGLAEESSPIQLLANALTHQRVPILFAAVAGLIQFALIVAGLAFLREFVRVISHGASQSSILGLLTGFLLVAVFKVLFSDCFGRIRSGIQKQVALRLEFTATEHIQHMTTESLARLDSNELAQRCQGDAWKIGNACSMLTETLSQLLVVAALIATTCCLDQAGFVWPLFVGLAVLIPLVSYLPGRHLVDLERELSEAKENVNKSLAEGVAGACAMRQNGQIAEHANEIHRQQVEVYLGIENLDRQRVKQQTAGLFFGGLVVTAVLGLSALAYKNDPGLIIVFFILANMVLFSLRRISIAVTRIPEFVHAARRHLDLLSEPREVGPAYDRRDETELRCERIRFEDVCGSSTAFENDRVEKFSLQLSQGQSALLIDDSGNCNQALADMLRGQSEIKYGKISVDDVELRDVDEVEIRRMISFTSGEPFIFQSSLKRNILARSESASIATLSRIVCRTGLEHLLDKLPKRFDTIIGRRGMFTTWDERYRIGLARVVAASGSPVIVLELPAYALPESLSETINSLIQTEWQNRIVLVLSNQLLTGIRCTRTLITNSQRQFVEAHS